MKNIDFKTAKAIMDQKLGEWEIMALASCADDYPMVRNVSCISTTTRSISRPTKISERRSSCL